MYIAYTKSHKNSRQNLQLAQIFIQIFPLCRTGLHGSPSESPWRLLDYFAFRCPKQLRNSENYTEKAKALAGRSWPETVLPSEELPFTMEKSFTFGTHRAELELRLDGTLWLFVEADDPP